ncbi:MAG: VWA domain-containing protein, partial [Blastocatellia bacterium]|nr:VWA domain-containing protein [Blastocatellia bacterium]
MQNVRIVCLVLIAIATFSLPASFSAFAQTGNDKIDKTLSPYFFVQGDPTVDRLPLKDTSVQIDVSGVIADVQVMQTYKNEGSRAINARYVFPASTRAAVYAMRMRIGDQVIAAKIKEREQAKQEFDKAKQEGKSASLLEQQRPNVFSMNLANIMPGDQIEIELRYTELLVPTDGIYEVVFPTVVGPRYSSPQPDSSASQAASSIKVPYLHQGENPTSALHISARISAGVPIRDLTCTTHHIDQRWESPTIAKLTLDDPDPFQGNRDFILHYRLSGDQIASGLLLYQGQGENYFLYMAQPPERVTDAEIPAREYIFVVDVSGSMYGFPLNTAKSLLRDLIGKLRPSDTFNIVLFAGGSSVLSPRSLPANQENIAKGIGLVDKQQGGGATEMLPAVQEAMSLPRQENVSRSIVLVTDGYIDGEKGVFDYIRSNLDRCNVFSFGIGS